MTGNRRSDLCSVFHPHHNIGQHSITEAKTCSDLIQPAQSRKRGPHEIGMQDAGKCTHEAVAGKTAQRWLGQKHVSSNWRYAFVRPKRYATHIIADTPSLPSTNYDWTNPRWHPWRLSTSSDSPHSLQSQAEEWRSQRLARPNTQVIRVKTLKNNATKSWTWNSLIVITPPDRRLALGNYCFRKRFWSAFSYF